MADYAKIIPITSATMNAVDRARLARLPAPVHDVQAKGKQILQKALQSLFDNVDDALFELADRATNNRDQNLYFDSMREVRIQRRNLEQGFLELLAEALANLASTDCAKAPEPNYTADLDVVDHDELEQLVAVDAMVTKAIENAGESLQYFSLRLDSLVPASVLHKNNPFGPQLLCKHFVQTTHKLSIDIKAKLVLFKLFDQHVVAQFPAMYEALNSIMIEHKVMPLLNRQPASPSSGDGNRQSPAAALVSVAGQQPPVLTNPSAEIHQLLGTQSGVASSDTVADKAALTRLLSELQHRQQLDDVNTMTSSPALMDINQLLTQMAKAQHTSVAKADADVVNLVKMLFEFILRDGSLADTMKAQIARLQIPIVKVALMDRSFFDKGGHPARRLLNEMATACLGWQEGQVSLDRDLLYQKIQGIVERLLSEFDDDVDLFSEVLTDFVSFNEREKRRARILEQRALDAEDGRAKAELARQQVTNALNQRINGRVLPAEVAAILTGPWSNVLFLLCLRDGCEGAEWQNAIKTVDQLIWSVTVPLEGDNQEQLMQVLPALLKQIRSGMELIAHNPFETTNLLKELETLHLRRLSEKAGIPSAAEKIKPAPNINPPVEQPSEQVATNRAGPAEIPTMAEVVRDLHPPAVDEPKEPAPVVEVAVEVAIDASQGADNQTDNQIPVEKHYLGLVSKLTQGTWFEAHDEEGQSFRCRLAAIIKVTGNYIFVNRNGMKVAEESVESLALALQTGRLRLLDDGMLFDRALESVIGQMRRTKPGSA